MWQASHSTCDVWLEEPTESRMAGWPDSSTGVHADVATQTEKMGWCRAGPSRRHGRIWSLCVAPAAESVSGWQRLHRTPPGQCHWEGRAASPALQQRHQATSPELQCRAADQESVRPAWREKGRTVAPASRQGFSAQLILALCFIRSSMRQRLPRGVVTDADRIQICRTARSRVAAQESMRLAWWEEGGGRPRLHPTKLTACKILIKRTSLG